MQQTPTTNISAELREFIENIQAYRWKRPTFWMLLVGYFTTFFFCYFPDVNSFSDGLVGGIFIFCWFRLVKLIAKEFKPPTILLWGCVVGLWLIEYLLIWSVLDPAKEFLVTSFFANVIQVNLIALLILCGSLLIVVANRNKLGILVMLLGFMFVVEPMITSDSRFLLYLFLGFITILLLKSTEWLNRFTKVELWVYFGIFIALFQMGLSLNPFSEITKNTFEYKELWFSAPAYFYYIILCYVVAYIIKIPNVLIYNFASLSRKLRIAGLFQSTIPQIIQLFALVFIFYSFIVTWQAQTMRDRLVTYLETMEVQDSTNTTVFEYVDEKVQIDIDGFQKKTFQMMPPKGVLALKNIRNENTFFVYKPK